MPAGADEYRPYAQAGIYVPTASPAVPLWGRRKPWLMGNAAQFRPAAPPALNTATWERDYDEVKSVGARSSTVRVCSSTPTGLDDSNCVSYGSYSKPEGAIQRNARTKRFGAISYSTDGSNTRDGGVLRSDMKYVGPTLPDGSTNSVAEFRNDGTLVNNPDGASGGLNSGVINYINKFSDAAYKSLDPVSELFYESIRYFKHLGPTPEYSAGLTDAQKGGFQIVNSWSDPQQYKCQKNFIIAINDANPWLDKKLPGTFFTSSTMAAQMSME
jgi:type IV pilus assembly protein PilY1